MSTSERTDAIKIWEQPKHIVANHPKEVQITVIVLSIIAVIGVAIVAIGAARLGGVNVSFFNSLTKFDAILMVSVGGGISLLCFFVIGALKLIEQCNAAKKTTSDLEPPPDDSVRNNDDPPVTPTLSEHHNIIDLTIRTPPPVSLPIHQGIPLAHLIADPGQGKMSQNLATHWLKDAATRIFNQPLRSFLELIVNALDASLPEEKGVGKFGLGFISILTFLDHPETQGCTIQIDTTAENKDHLLSTYSMDLFKENETYQVLFTDQESKSTTGTTITIKPKADSFSDETLSTLLDYCMTLEFYEHGKIEVIHKSTKYTLGEGENVLAWVTLENNQISVRDQGCGITREVAKRKLFVPSASTKNHKKFSKIPPAKLPEFKKCANNQNKPSSFLVSINGVVIIDLPYECPESLLLKMPSSTRLTLARDAIENRPESVRYLKSVIDATLQNATSKEGSALLLALYNGLKKWEAQVPSMADAKLVAYLHTSVQEMFQKNPDLIPYPFEHADALQPLLQSGKPWIPFPGVLLFDHFASFESYIQTQCIDNRDDLISGKTVVFVEGIHKVSAFGLRNLVFAPLSLLKTPVDLLPLALVTQFADAGKYLEVVSSTTHSPLPPSLANLRGPQQFVFLTSRDTPPIFEEPIALPRRPLFDSIDDAPFIEFWEKHQQSVIEHMLKRRGRDRDISIVTMSYFDFISKVRLIEKNQTAWESLIVSDGQTYWRIRDYKSALLFTDIIKSHTKYPGDVFQFYKDIEANMNAAGFKEKYLSPMSTAELSKIYFEWIFDKLGVGSANSIIKAGEIFWPTQKPITCDFLERCFQIFIQEERNILADTTFLSADDQEKMWMTLEPFMDYPDGVLAIEKVFSLFQLQERLTRLLPIPLQERFKLCVQQLLSMYHRFATIIEADVPVAYGSSLPSFIDRSDHKANDQFLACPINDMVNLLASLSNKEHLFEKCIYMLIQEMSIHLSIKERNKKLKCRISPVFTDVLFNNCISMLSLAKAKGINQSFIETALYHSQKPFELHLISLLFLSDDLGPFFSQTKDIEKLNAILIYIITIYFNKIDLKSWEYKTSDKYNFSTEWRLNYTFKSLLDPLVNYIKEAGKASFEIDLKMIPAAINQKLKTATSFTSMQVIHAAQKGGSFSKALKEGELQKAVTEIRKEPTQTDLQMITQAVEHGSERSSVESTLIEAFQNSVDAMRGFLKKNSQAGKEKTQIVFDVRLVGEKQPQLLLQIEDKIGMKSLETLLADFLIPNYSKKSKDAEAVGEMGNGSYQMYRDADLVTVQTRTLTEPSRVYFLRIIPIRHAKTGEVIDLRHKCVDITDSAEADSFVGTTLRVRMRSAPHTPQAAIELEGLAVRNFIQETFSVAFPSLENQRRLECTLKLTKDGIIPLDDIQSGLPFTRPGFPFSCYKRRNEMNPGCVLTNGHPFKSLETFLVEEKLLPADLAADLSQGWCLNLPKGTYQPVQNRTRVQMTPEVKKHLQKFLLEWIYYRSMDGESSKPGVQYYPHFNSTVSGFNQIYPGATKLPDLEQAVLNQGDFRSLESFFVHYVPSFLQKSFLSYINDGYKNLIPTLNKRKNDLYKAFEKNLTVENCETEYKKLITQFTQDCEAIKKKWIESFSPKNALEHSYINRIIAGWFSKKIKGFVQEISSLKLLKANYPHLRTKEEIEEANKIDLFQHDLDLPNLLNQAVSILQPYCALYAEKNALEKKGPNVRFYYALGGTEAFYVSDKHEIAINLANVSLTSIFEMGKKLAAKRPPNHPLVSITNGDSGTLNHELEHARRGHSCNGNGHEYGFNIEGEYVHFEACAASYARNAHQKGLMVEWSQALQHLPFPSPEQLAQLHSIEQNHPGILKKACTPK